MNQPVTRNSTQVDFPIVYASGANGTAGPSPEELAPDLVPLFDAIVMHVSPPAVRVADPLQLLVTNLDYDEFKGRLCIGRVTAGHLMRGEQIIITKPGGTPSAVPGPCHPGSGAWTAWASTFVATPEMACMSCLGT